MTPANRIQQVYDLVNAGILSTAEAILVANSAAGYWYQEPRPTLVQDTNGRFYAPIGEYAWAFADGAKKWQRPTSWHNGVSDGVHTPHTGDWCYWAIDVHNGEALAIKASGLKRIV